MHILGKILVWFLFPLAVTAVVLAGRMVQVRNSWNKRYEQIVADFETNAKQLAEKQKRLTELQAELSRTLLGWDQYWTDVQIPQPGGQTPGSLQASVGIDRGITEGQTVYVFRPDPEGNGMLYVGPFLVQSARQGVSGLVPKWRLRPDEASQWNLGPGWRIWVHVPASALAEYADLEVAFALADELLNAKQSFLQAQQKLKQSAQEHLNLRLKELHGDPDKEPDRGQLPQYLIDGLVKALEDEEEARDAVLAKVDELRREVKVEFERYAELHAENRKLVEQLPQPTTPVTAKK